MSSTERFCRAFGKILCSPCLIIYSCIIGSDKDEDETRLIPGEPEVVVSEPNVDYGTSQEIVPKTEESTTSQTLSPGVSKVDRSTMLWDYSDIFIQQEATKANRSSAILEESDDVLIIHDNEKQNVLMKPETIGSAFVPPDVKEEIKKSDVIDSINLLIHEEAVIVNPQKALIKEMEKKFEIQKESTSQALDDEKPSAFTKPEYKEIQWEKEKKPVKKPLDSQSFLDLEKY